MALPLLVAVLLLAIQGSDVMAASDAPCPFGTWRSVVGILSASTSCRGCDFHFSDCVLHCRRCAFGMPAEVDLRSCPSSGQPRIHLTPLGLVCIRKGARRFVTNTTLASSPPPPSGVAFGPPPPMGEVNTTISQAEISITGGHPRPADFEFWTDSISAESNEQNIMSLVQTVDNSTDFVSELDADPTDPILDLRSGDVVDITLTQSVDPGVSVRRRVLLEAAHGTMRRLHEIAPAIVSPGGQGKLSIASFRKTSANGGKDFIVGNTPVNLTSLTFLMHMCGKNLTFTRDTVNRIWFNRFATTNNYTLQKHHEVCSYNKLRFPPETNLVLGPVTVPCSGVVSVTSNTDNRATGATYTYDFASRCGNDERYGLWELAKRWLQANQPAVYANIRSYKRKLLLMSDAPACGWRGLGNSGCGSSHCISWIRSSPSLTDDMWAKQGLPDATTVFQELGHNIGLNHAGRLYPTSGSLFATGAYDDMTDPMGGGYPDATRMAAGPVCLSAPQAYKAGWASPIAFDEEGTTAGDVELWDLVEGKNYFYQLPSMHLGDKCLIRIRMSASFALLANAPVNARLLQQAYFISFRLRQGSGRFDHALRPVFDGRVAVHEYNGTASAKTDNPLVLSGLRQLLTPGIPLTTQVFGRSAFTISRTWTSPELPVNYIDANIKGGTLTIQVVSAVSATATARVRLCRTTRTEVTLEDCQSGDDYNCDGVPDNEQEICDALLNSHRRR